VRDEIASLDPPPDRTGGNVKAFRNLGDREEPDLIIALMATTDVAESSRFRAGALSSSGHASGREFSRPQGHRPSLASRRATKALMLATVILRERPSLKLSSSPAANSS
jgi:hypothetical protein